MPHLIFQTNFPLQEESAEISFFGNVERETIEALQHCTVTALQKGSATEDPTKTMGHLQPSPYSPDVLHYNISIPGTWEFRQTVQNILRVSWMDTFERAGWRIVSMWSTKAGAPSCLDPEKCAASLSGTNSTDAAASVGKPDGKLAASLSGSAVFKGESANFLLFKPPQQGADAHGKGRSRSQHEAGSPTNRRGGTDARSKACQEWVDSAADSLRSGSGSVAASDQVGRASSKDRDSDPQLESPRGAVPTVQAMAAKRRRLGEWEEKPDGRTSSRAKRRGKEQ
mmetsp:Transcript_62989/g.130908  ORF Transcript_62989/g.130908 Transcript_62989/m.130908 type:complete len:283 (-) Transcript_62989:78-926(-)|eukprot:CAMPEP_0181290784 /NCGR_PEP_ID=MMETSP1101-20121128/1599_1 /TAXON_ID=46948 /ORGANISM="Rhodomonas abbreviata, Strain Caron Lab Isolate" /LENGTH=282 /DNA_ID=CAMNT_0023395093 /DNA_START=367 /DNA_END=1215 /DNA_ORIENTATION=-